MGLLRTMLGREGVETDMFSLRSLRSWRELPRRLEGYDMLIMNVRSYTFPFAYKAAQTFNCQGPGEKTIVQLAQDPVAFPRMVMGEGARSMADWPVMDRTLWPDPRLPDFPWPLEPECGWGPGPVATILTSRVCPWQCVFCNESSFIPNMGRRPVEAVIEELNYLDDHYGPLGSVVIHDSMFFQQPTWLREWVDKYPRLAHKPWPYWAAARSDTVRQWPDLFEALIRETNWNTISIGFESGSDRVLKILNKECTAEDNYVAIDLLNRIADDFVRRGREAPRFWANIMLGIPGETREDAFDTIRMLKRMRRVMPSISYYAPYPGSALGYQLIAEGKSLMSKENYHRYPNDEKVRGIDYRFYNRLLAGKFEREVNRNLPTFMREKSGVYQDSLIKA
ncbi:MAG: radical SAM protein [Chloroflexi bacterium]|nr:radical SAM protein [Chloroflexota bacterium]